MASTSADRIDHILPERAPLRQLVLTLPFELRARLAFDGALCGAVTAIQRFSSDLRQSPHFHALALDGAFVEDEAGELAFRLLPPLTSADVANLLQIARSRIVRLLRRNGVLTDDEQRDTSVVAPNAVLEAKEPALAAIAAASIAGTVPAGPALCRQEPIKPRYTAELAQTQGLCAVERGFSLHAATTAAADDWAGKEAPTPACSLRTANGGHVSSRRRRRPRKRKTPTARRAPRRETSLPRIAQGIAHGVSSCGKHSRSTSSTATAAARA